LRRGEFALVCLLVSSASLLVAGEPEDTWIDLPPLPLARQEVGVAALEGKVYVVGGILPDRSATGLVSRFDTASGAWEAVAPLPDGTQLHHAGAAALDGKVYCVGGLDAAFRGVSSVFAFDPSTGAWARAASLNRARGAMGVAAVAGRIYAAGGQDGSTTLASFEAYDPGENRWVVLPALPTARNHLAAAASGGLFFAVGGRAGSLRNQLECFDPAAGAWRPLRAMPTARGGIAAEFLAGKLFVFGGEGNAARADGIFPHVEAYDPATDAWERRPDMANPRHGIGAVAVGERIHIPGGAPVQGFATTPIHDVFVPREVQGFGEERFRRGDANRDDIVDISDPVLVLFALFLGEIVLPCEDAADANDDGSHDVADAVRILAYLFQGGEPLPPPGAVTPGPDPTADDFSCADSE
jgi:N-acetylneuraminic acid mutarotase